MAASLYNQSKQLVSVDCIIFGYEDEELKLLVFNRKIEPSIGGVSLVGGWVNDNESVEDAARNVLQRITGLSDIFMEQVYVFSQIDRDPGGRVISVVFYALIHIDAHDRKLVEGYGARWISIKNMPELIFDHNVMVEKALEKVRLKATYELIGKELLPEKFTILQLRNLYNALFIKEFDPGNFRKKVLSLKVLERLNSKNTTESRKGAYYYKFKDNAEESNKNTIVKLHG
jgi:ADP-ribose pyrophosphatase YjhB (NUDIX family)